MTPFEQFQQFRHILIIRNTALSLIFQTLSQLNSARFVRIFSFKAREWAGLSTIVGYACLRRPYMAIVIISHFFIDQSDDRTTKHAGLLRLHFIRDTWFRFIFTCYLFLHSNFYNGQPMLLILNNTHGFSAFTVFKAKNAHENCIHRYSEIRVELANCSPNTLQNFKLMYIMYILSNACNCI